MDESEFDKMVEELQEMVDAKDKEDLSEHAWELGRNPQLIGTLPADSPGYITARGNSDCGDELTFHMIIENKRIRQIRCEVRGCTLTTIAGSQAALLTQGKTIEEAKKITAHTILDALGKFPPANSHCAALAAAVLHQALRKVN
jgi:nitrogen fixation NifU-like protein